ncbi:MAG: sulfotransferase family protein [Phycisphaeraceae bacterium]
MTNDATTFNKVFGIGLNKTGTTSLAMALNQLKIPVADFPHDCVTRRELEVGQYHLSVLEHHRGATDTSVAAFYAQLDQAYPNSKFILTVRPSREDWLRSLKKQLEGTRRWWHPQSNSARFMYFINTATYGVSTFQPERMAFAYDLHVKNVLHYFADRPDDLLVMNIMAGDGYDKLCPFLGLEPMTGPFPKANTRDEREGWLQAMEQAVPELRAVLPDSASVALVDDGYLHDTHVQTQWNMQPFPSVNGLFAGPPADSEQARELLEHAIADGLEYLLFAWPGMWWLDHYAVFHRYLRERHPCLLDNERFVLFRLKK